MPHREREILNPEGAPQFTVFTLLKGNLALPSLNEAVIHAGATLQSTGCAATLFLGAFFLFRPGDIFADDGGMVSLRNSPADGQYKPKTTAGSRKGDGRPGNAAGKFANKARFEKIINEIAGIYGVDKALLHAVVSVESGYSPNAVSSKGACGLMQLMPETARRYGVADSLDPVQNLHGGAKYLSYLLKLFNSDVSLALAAYNAGEFAVLKHGGRLPPSRETARYVPRVLAFYNKYYFQT